MNSTDTITSKQLIYIIIGAQIGMGVFSLPRLAGMEAHQNAWLAVFLGGLLPFLILFIIERLGRRMPESGFVAMNQLLFGRWLGSVMVFLFVVYIIFFEATVVRMFTEVTSAFLLPRTPLPVIAFIAMLAVVYAINKGARVVARLNEILFWIILPLLVIIMIPLAGADYTNLLPVGEAGLKSIARGALSCSTAYAGIEVLLVFYFLVRQKGEIIKAGILGLGYTMLVYVLVTVICQVVWGNNFIQTLNWPVFTVFKTIRFPVLERPEIFMLAVWMGVGIRPTMNMGFAAAYSLSEVLHVKRDKYFHLVVIAIALPVYILALLPPNLIIAFKWAEYAGYTFLLAGLFYPLLMLVVAVIRGKEAQSA
ncbi:MAG: endospore germination permease [Syntrophomonadaceae bacterium]|nr:endospore germination permease [Syntrophomonadaceae bacterium]